MSIYDDPIAYARQTRIPIRLSRIWCAHNLKLRQEAEAARKCPKCGQLTLELEGGCYEEGTRDYVYCANDQIPQIDEEDGSTYFGECDYTAAPEDKHIPLSSWYGFDVILAFSCGMIDRKQEYPNLAEWLAFVRKEVGEISKSDGGESDA